MILEGRTLAAKIRAPLAQRADVARQKLGRPIRLHAYGCADDYGAYVYLNKEIEAARKTGIDAQGFPISAALTAEQFLTLIAADSANPEVDAILIARPLPEHLSQSGYERVLAPEKDIDGMSHVNMGNLFLCKTWDEVEKRPGFASCTAMAVIRLLEYHGIDPQGMEAAVIGRSFNVGRPLAHLLSCKNATVKICHTKTRDLKASLRGMELICCAAGKPGLLTADIAAPGSVVVDIATNVTPDGKLCGDADTQTLLQKGCSVSPVPGGVGPVTLACLLENIILSGERKFKETK